jgi:hypothetical protein
MPKLSLYRPQKSNDYKFLDKTISEMFTVGSTDLFIHKYVGVKDTGPSKDLTQPQYTNSSVTDIQDLLFLENRDRKYDPDIYRLRGHYNVQNLDFDLSQFGLFLNNDIIFITVHYNNMIDIIGRKLMVGDVLELPHLTDYHPLNETIPTGMRRYYQITDGNFASEGFTSTWYPHLWRIKCEPLVNTQEFADILDQPISKDNFLGDWDKAREYPTGYTVTYGGSIYTPKAPGPVPIGAPPTDTTYWQLSEADTLQDIIGRYNKNIQINNAVIEEAARILPKAGYDRSQLYVVPTFDNNMPAPPIGVIITKESPEVTGRVEWVTSDLYNNPSPVLRISAAALKNLWDLTADDTSALKSFIQASLQAAEIAPERTDTGSGSVEHDIALTIKSLGPVSGPYGTSDNTYITSDQDPEQPGFYSEIIPNVIDYRADTDPRFRYIKRMSPRSFGYVDGYLTGDGTAPNGEPVSAGTNFPPFAEIGDYFLRIDYLPQQLFRWDGNLWVKISDNVRTGVGFTEDDKSQLSTFINNSNVTVLTNGTTMPERQSLSSILRIQTD